MIEVIIFAIVILILLYKLIAIYQKEPFCVNTNPNFNMYSIIYPFTNPYYPYSNPFSKCIEDRYSNIRCFAQPSISEFYFPRYQNKIIK